MRMGAHGAYSVLYCTLMIRLEITCPTRIILVVDYISAHTLAGGLLESHISCQTTGPPPRYCKRQMLRTSKTHQNAHRLTHRSQVCGDRVSKTGDRTRSTGLSCQMIVNSSACGLRVKFVWDQHVQPA